MAQVISKAPDNVIQALPYDLGWWLRAQSKVFSEQEELFFELIQRLLALEYEDVDLTDDPMDMAINHPVGQATEAILRWWHRPELKGSQGIKDEVKSLFTKLCDTEIEKFRFGRILLAAHAIELFRVDEDWAKTHLLPLFNWQQSEIEARAAWDGFLWSPCLYRPLLAAIKQPFLETAEHYEQLGTHAEQYAAFLTFAALDPGDTFTTEELAEATCKLPTAGLQRALIAVTDALKSSGEQRSEYWRNRVVPYLGSVWPQTSDVLTPAISEQFGQLCVAARESFPEALGRLQDWLRPVKQPFYLIHLLNEAKLCEKFPSDALEFLYALIDANALLLPQELKQCLDAIENADQSLTNDRRLTRLTELLERHDIS
jgi:hypothetical protein